MLNPIKKLTPPIVASTPKFPRELVSLIIQKGGDVSKQSNVSRIPVIVQSQANLRICRIQSGRTPLNSAVRRSRKLVPIFLAHGADPFVRTVNGKNAVDWAKENNRLLLQLRLEETRNVVVLCMPFSVKKIRTQQERDCGAPEMESAKPHNVSGKGRKKAVPEADATVTTLSNINAPVAPITMLPIDLIRLVKDMLF